MQTESAIDVVIVGSIGIDTIETRFEKKEEILGGSVSYACAASSFFVPTGMVGVVGDDFPDEYRSLYQQFGINTEGLVQSPGKTFRWSGVYDDDMINRETLSTELNVFADFSPELPSTYKDAPFILLGNISPELQLHVLAEADSPRFVMADTMDLWINIANEPLRDLIGRVDMLALNDAEARLLTGKYNLRSCAAEIMKLGVRYVVIKKGEHGAMLFSDSGIFLVPAFPVDEVSDPTGAGDSFAGGFLGHLARAGEVTEENVRRALLAGSVVASFGVEAFSLDRLQSLDANQIDERLALLQAMMSLSPSNQ